MYPNQGHKQVKMMEQQVEKQPDIVFRIKKSAFSEQQAQSMRFIRPGCQSGGIAVATAHKGNIKPVACQKVTHFIDTRVCIEVIGDGQNNFIVRLCHGNSCIFFRYHRGRDHFVPPSSPRE